ncbi:MAG: hypothetical protein LUE31_05250, partial [Lachnospiraceae bacterium]|nr:hypothetical protein [Lachnospiraceae bacterium]
TYRLQFYAVLDLDYDGKADTGINGETITVGSETLVLAGYSDDITTREQGVSSGAGDYSRTIVGGSTLLTLRFSNAFNAGGITRVDYMLAKADGSVYDMVTLTKADGATSMFDATAGSGAGDGTDGTIYLTLDLAADETSTANVSEIGKYYLTVQMYTTDDSGEYVKSTGYSITFYNSTSF